LAIYNAIIVCKFIRKGDAVILGVINSIVIYSHYFGFLIIVSQLVICIFFWVQEERKGLLFKTLFITYCLVAISYIPWLPQLLSAGNIDKTWIAPLKPDFIVDFFNEYFCNSPALSWAAIALIVIYLINVFSNIKKIQRFKESPVALSFVVIIISLLVSLGIPYLRSILVVPMITARYTIIALPLILLAIAYGIETIPYKILRYSILLAFLTFSMYHIVYEYQFYRRVYKVQFREAVEYLTREHKNYAILNETTPAGLQYYLEKNNYKGKILFGKKEDLVDSILHNRRRKFNLDTFWMAGLFFDDKLETLKQRDLDTAFKMIRDTTFFEGWVQLYVSRKSIMNVYGPIYTKLNYGYFNEDQQIEDYGKTAVIWNGVTSMKPVNLKKGRYYISFLSRGTPVGSEFPRLDIYINRHKIGSYDCTADYDYHTLPFEVSADGDVAILLHMKNDSATSTEDRNAFVRNVHIGYLKPAIQSK
jgi:hypothetical protein